MPAKATPKKPVSRKPVKKQAKLHPLMVNARDWDKQKVMDILCNAIASSSKSITTILAAGHDGNTLPDYATIARWLAADNDGAQALCDQYARAKEAQAEFMAEELAELHNKAWIPVLDEDGRPVYSNGEPLMTVDKASAAIVRLESDNKKWLMGKLKPKRYGDKVSQEISGPNGTPIQTESKVEWVIQPVVPVNAKNAAS